MPRAPFENVLRYLFQASAIRGDCSLPDRELLERFRVHRDESAFTYLVRRHGAMVFGVCRRLLGDSHEAEDAFQATFLVLVRRIGSIRRRDSIVSWLYGVARRIALTARAQISARRRRERKARPMRGEELFDKLTSRELRSVLDEAIGALPEKYRAPILVCYLEGKSFEAASKDFGCSKATLSRRLAKARELLRRKLERHGIGLTAAALGTALTEMASAAPLPAVLTIKTVKAASLLVAGQAVAGTGVSAGALALAQEALAGMVFTKGKLIAMMVALALTVGGATWAGLKGNSELASTTEPLTRVDDPMPIPGKNKPEIKPALDTRGDPLPTEATARFGTLRLRHGQYVVSVAFSPDGKEVASSSYDGTIRFWDVKTGAELRRLPRQFDKPGCIAYTADGRELIVAEGTYHASLSAEFRGVRVWDLATGKLARVLGTIDRPLDARRAAASPRGDRIAFFSHQTLFVLDPLKPDKRLLPNEAASIDVEGARELTHVAWSPDGGRLAVGALRKAEGQIDPDKQHSFVRVYDLQTGKPIWERDGITGNGWGAFPAAAFSPDGKTLAVSYTYTEQMALVDSATGKVARPFASKTVGYWPFRFTADGAKLYMTGWGGPNEIWDVETRKPIRTWARGGYTVDLALSPDGTTMASAESRKIRLVNTASGELTVPDEEASVNVNRIELHPDGRRLVTGHGEEGIGFTVWDRKTSHRLFNYSKTAWTFSLAPDGKTLAVGSASDSPVIFDMGARKITREPEKNEVEVSGLAHLPDGSRIIYFSRWENNIREINPRTMASRLLIQMPERVNLFAFSLFRDGRRVAIAPWEQGSVNQQRFVRVEIWDLSERRKIQTLSGHLGGYPPSVAVSPDGKRVAAGSARDPFGAYYGDTQDTRLLLWNVDTGEQLAVLPGSGDGHRCIAFSPDGRLVAAGGQDHATYIWESGTGTLRAKLVGHEGPVTAVAFSSDSRTLYTGSSDTTILAWNLMTPFVNPGNKDTVWADLIHTDGIKAHRALRALISARDDTVAQLAQKLKRGRPPSDAEIAKLITDLDSPIFNTREAASKELIRIGRVSMPFLRNAARTGSLEMSLRAKQLLRTLDAYPLTGEAVLHLRAVEILEHIASPSAQRLLNELAGGAPGHVLTEEAKGAVGRLRGK